MNQTPSSTPEGNRRSYLAPGGNNLFQGIKEKTAEALAAGKKILKLSIGQPTGPAFLPARQKAAELMMSNEEVMHEYQDNGLPGVPDFARKFILSQLPPNVTEAAVVKPVAVEFLALPGMKPTLAGQIVLACGAGNPGEGQISVITTTPAYPTPAQWCGYLGNSVRLHEMKLTSKNEFRFNPADLPFKPTLIMLNYPNNPTGQIATREYWHIMCKFCEENDIRLFNDAAYSILPHSSDHCSLAEVAVQYKRLSWCEAYSASKAGNFTGWRVAALIGSPDFVKDVGTIKGNADSGGCAPQFGGVLHVYENHQHLIREQARLYRYRLDLLTGLLVKSGMRLAVRPGAGFFSLWQMPTRAFGQKIETAEQFNYLMIEKVGVVGVQFHPYIRYSVCSDIKAMAADLTEAFALAEVSYDAQAEPVYSH